MLWEIAHILSDGFDMTNHFSETTEFTPIDPASNSYYKWSCLPDGLASPDGENPIPKEMQTGSYWTRSLGASGQGAFGEERFTSLGVESITVPAGTFDAVKVQGVTRSLRGVTYFDWYVKGIGLVKTYTESSMAWSTRELISYSLPK